MCYAVNQLNRGCTKRAKMHMSADKHALRHLKGSADLLIICKRGQLRLNAYRDASFAASLNNRKPTSSFLFILWEGPTSFGATDTDCSINSGGGTDCRQLRDEGTGLREQRRWGDGLNVLQDSISELRQDCYSSPTDLKAHVLGMLLYDSSLSASSSRAAISPFITYRSEPFSPMWEQSTSPKLIPVNYAANQGF